MICTGKKSIWVGIIAGLLIFSKIYGQQLPAVYDSYAIFSEGIELYDAQKYSAAQEKFERFYHQDKSLNTSAPHNTLSADAMFYAASCDFHLLRGDAEEHLQEFIAEYPTHAKSNNARYYLGKIFYIKRNFRKAVEYLASVDLSSVEESANHETRFMLGYSYFQIDKQDLAAETLEPLTQNEGEFRDKAAYYYGIMQFKRKKFEESYTALKSIDTVAEYKLKIPIYLSSILLEQDKFDQLDRYGTELLNSNEAYEQKELIYKQIGLALYELKKYKRAIPYFEANLENNNAPESGVFYRIGYSHYQEKEYDPAVFYLSKLFVRGDSTAQVASYFTAFAYIATEKEEEARLAFKRCVELKYNPDIRKDALLQYAKLSLENKYYNEALQGFKAYAQDYPEADNIKEVKGLAGEALYFSSNFKDAIRLLEGSGLQDKRSKLTYQKALYFHAVNLYSRNQPEDAVRYFTKSGEVNDGDPEMTLQSHFWRGEVYYSLKNYKDAEKAYTQFTKTTGAKNNEYYPNVLIGLGWVTLVGSDLKPKDKYEEARDLFSKAVHLPNLKTEKPELFIEASLRTADCHFALKEYAQAEKNYQSVYEMKRIEADYALFQWATCKLRQSKYEAAIDKFKEIDEHFDRSEFKDEALLQISNTYLNWLTDFKNAFKYAQKLVEEHPRSELRPKAMLNCGFAASQLDQKGEAVGYFRAVLKDYGNQTDEAQVALDELGSLLGTSEMNDLLDQFKSQNPNSKIKTDNILFKTGRDLYEIQNDPAGAVSQLTKYIQEYPNGTYYFEAYYVRGLANYDLRFTDKALTDLAKVFDGKSTPDLTSKAYTKTASIYADQKNYDKAVSYYQKAEGIVENNVDRFQIRMAMGEIHFKVKNYSEAQKRFEQVALDPNTTEFSKGKAQVAWAKAWYYMGKIDSSESLFRKVEADNKNVFGAESQYWIAQILFDGKKYEDCKSAVFYMKDNYPTQNYWKAKAFILLAEVFRIEKDYFQAVETMKSIAEHSPDDEIKNDAKIRLAVFEKEAQDPEMNPNGFEDEEVEVETGNPVTNNKLQQDDEEDATDDLFDDSEPVVTKPAEKTPTPPVKNNTYKPDQKPKTVTPPTAKTESGDKKAVAPAPAKTETKKDEPKADLKKVEPKKQESVKPQTNYENKDLGRSEPPKTVEPKKEFKPAGVKVITTKENTAYHIVVESVTGMNNAEAAAQKWKAKGFKVILMEGSKENMLLVSVYSSGVYAEASASLVKLKKEEKVPQDAWLLYPPKKDEPVKPTPKTDYKDKDLGRSEPPKEIKKTETKPTAPTKDEPVKATPKTDYKDKDLGRSEPKTSGTKPSESKKTTEPASKPVVPKKVEPTKKGENKETSSEATSKITFHVIAETVTGTKNAEEAAKKWKSKGFSVLILQGGKDNLFLISVYSSKKYFDAYGKLDEWKKAKKIPADSWFEQNSPKN